MYPSILRGAAILASISIASALGGTAPVRTPVFSNPLNITNPYANVPAFGSSGSKWMYSSSGTWEFATYPARTRTFHWNGQQIECRVQVEQEIEDDEVTETSETYFAQADDGSVYCFGDSLVWQSPSQPHEPSWIVGGPSAPADPSDALDAAAPMLSMPAAPKLGASWKLVELLPVFDESAAVVGVRQRIETAGGSFVGCLAVEIDDSDEAPHIKVFAPGIGEVFEQRRDGWSTFIALDMAR